MKLLLHACCAPCSYSAVEGLREDNISPVLFWYNPNIHPYTEYLSRKESLAAFVYEEKFELISEAGYGLREFLIAVCKNNEDFSNERRTLRSGDCGAERCAACYRMRLEETAFTAMKNGFDAFSTTLLTSPHQNHDLIKKIGAECGEKAGVEFFYRDLRPWFRDGRKKAKEKQRYMQKYCGCIFSEEERYM